MSQYCDVCGEEPCECAEIAAQLEEQERESDLMLWRSGSLDWAERANAPGFSMWRYLRVRYASPDRLVELASRASPFMQRAAIAGQL